MPNDRPRPTRTPYMRLHLVQARLARLWLLGAASISLVLIIQSVAQKYRGQETEVWGWALPTLLPTLSLIVSVLGAGALDVKHDRGLVRQSFSRVAYWLSAAYLLAIMLTILIEPFTEAPPLYLLRLSNLWLGPFQALVASAVGVLFFAERPDAS